MFAGVEKFVAVVDEEEEVGGDGVGVKRLGVFGVSVGGVGVGEGVGGIE